MNTDDEPPRSLSLASSMPPYTEARNLKPTFPRIPCSWGTDHILNPKYLSQTLRQNVHTLEHESEALGCFG